MRKVSGYENMATDIVIPKIVVTFAPRRFAEINPAIKIEERIVSLKC